MSSALPLPVYGIFPLNQVNEYQITVTGTPQYPIELIGAISPIFIPPKTTSGTKTYTNESGLCLNSFTYVEDGTNAGISAITFDNLTGSSGTFNISSCINLTSMSFPLLNIMSSFSCGLSNLTSLTLPSLVSITGSFSPTLASINSLSLPVCTLINTFGPTLNSISFTSLSLPVLATVTNFAPIIPYLTSLSLPVCTTIYAFGPTFNSSSFTSLSLPVLATVTNFTATIPHLTSLSLVSLVNVVGSFSPTLASVTSLSLPACTTINTFTPTLNSASFTSLSLPVLATVTSFVPVIPYLVSLTLPLLTTIGGGLVLTNMANLTTISMVALISVNGAITFTTGFGKIANVQFGSNITSLSTYGTLKSVNGNVNLSGQALTQASVDGILIALAMLDGTNGTTAYSGRTITLNLGTNATPSATGLTAKATLVARGCTVTNN